MQGEIISSKVVNGELTITIDIGGLIVQAVTMQPEVVDNLQSDCGDFLCGH